MNTAIETARRHLHAALAAGEDTGALRIELRQLEAEAFRVAGDEARVALAAADAAAARISAEAGRIVDAADEQRRILLARFEIEEDT
ncbi:hypothetical protein [Paraburkholderia hospita]|uniref:hypothetical protein n=1 Tax=Paraburkholderia hospita TaxID=169430 RepID=UPI000271BFDC|nr:hypothetical protein [Paraburkholderia hospita]EUC21473.1 hypothetical protein PMI06_009189 [Burkholderia sp. BT03]SKC95320.1 hypothetical protein SAMN06266956_6896 [Paraburkholderia hospita]